MQAPSQQQIDLDKKKLRDHYRRERSLLTPALRAKQDESLRSELLKLIRRENVKSLLSFRSFADEPNINPLMDQLYQDLQIYLPVVQSHNQMVFYRYEGPQKLVENRFGIKEPSGRELKFMDKDPSVVLVPGFAFDQSGYRLGYGGGFYDRFLAKNPNLQKVGVAYKTTIQRDPLPRDGYDQAVDRICHEAGVIDLRADV